MAILSLIIAMLSIQFGASLAKGLFPTLGAIGTSTLRIVFAAIILIIILKPWRTQISTQSLRKISLYGIALGMMNLTFYLAIQRIPLGIAVALEFVGPLGVAILASRQKLDFLWAALAIFGIVLIIPQWDGPQHLDLMGVALALTAGLCWGLYIIFGQKIDGAISSRAAVSIGMVVAGLVVLPFGITTAGSDLLQIKLWPLAIGVALLSSALPYWLEMIALRALPARNFGILMSLEPVIASLSGYLFLAESLTLKQMTAIVLVISASWGSTITSKA